MRVVLFEDHGVVDLEPLTLARPVFDLYCGASPLSAKQARYFAPCTTGALVRPFLADLLRRNGPGLPVNDLNWLRQGPALMVNGRWLPPDGPVPDLSKSRPMVATIGGEVTFALVTADMLAGCDPANFDESLDEWKRSLPRQEAGGTMIARPWDFLAVNGRQIGRDFRARGEQARSARPMDFSLVGPAGQLCIDQSARIDPLVVADTTGGPVIIDRDAVITAFTKLEGPCYIGPGTCVLGARIRAGTTLGPYCRIGGEVENSIVQGFSNKSHDGYLGHSHVGEWVNIGAGAQTSDLRHDYGEVVLNQGGIRLPTGSAKVGSFIGDHSKIGVGSLLNTGTNLGAFTNILPAGRLLPRYVPSFCQVTHGVLTENNDCEVLFATAQEVMRRRGVDLTETQHEVYRAVFEQTAPHRRQTLHEVDRPRLRRSA
jgi:UDP-N-acetylglucosamine diphosphorylase/glucosamine-1-phosphate N-acetyltransferase